MDLVICHKCWLWIISIYCLFSVGNYKNQIKKKSNWPLPCAISEGTRQTSTLPCAFTHGTRQTWNLVALETGEISGIGLCRAKVEGTRQRGDYLPCAMCQGTRQSGEYLPCAFRKGARQTASARRTDRRRRPSTVPARGYFILPCGCVWHTANICCHARSCLVERCRVPAHGKHFAVCF